MTDLESVKSEPAHLVEPKDDKDFWRVVCEPRGRFFVSPSVIGGEVVVISPSGC